MGMNVVAMSTSMEKKKEAMELGAREFVCSQDKVQMGNWLKDPSDIILNTAYIDDLTVYMYGLAAGGKFINVGAPDVGKTFKFNHMDLVCN